MKKLLIIIAVLLSQESFSQTQRDVLKNDSTHRERIQRMPMDSTNFKYPGISPDSSSKRKERGDDADPKIFKDSLRRDD